MNDDWKDAVMLMFVVPVVVACGSGCCIGGAVMALLRWF